MREFFQRLASFFLRSRRDRDLEAELEAHIGFAIDENLARGLAPDEARRQALLRFGSRDSARELQRDARSLPILETLSQDLRYTFRAMRREPGFTLFAILIVGLGIGASVTVFSVLNTVLIQPLPFHQPERLVWFNNAKADDGLSGQTFQVMPFLAFRERNQSFSDIAAYFAFYGVGDSKLRIGSGEPERLNTLPVSENFFPLLGVQPTLGRQFSPEECKWNGPRAVMLSHSLWTERFNSDPHIVGRALTVNDKPVTVVGVLPASFDFGAVFAPGTRMDLYEPFPLAPETDRWGNTLALVGRLKSGAGISSAQAEATPLAARITAENPNRNSITPRLSPLKEQVSGKLRPALAVLAGAVGVVMLIVCANLSNLLLARGIARQKELAIRSALGAGRTRLIRQILTESLVLALLGALLGTGLAYAGTRGLTRLTAFKIPLLASVHLDLTALLLTLLLALVTGIVLGIVPALQVPRYAVSDQLKDQSRGTTNSRRHAWIRGTLVVSEIAFACVLIVATGLLIRSFLRVLDVNLGFQPERAQAMRVDSSRRFANEAQANAYFDEVLRRVRAQPGIESAGLSDSLPLGRNRSWGAGAKGVVYPRGTYPSAIVHVVTDGYFRSMGIAIKEGRDFDARDNENSEIVIIVNETLARRLWPGQNALGQRMYGGRPDRVVIGVVSDVRNLALEQDAGPEMYISMRQTRDYPSVDLVVRSRLDTANLSRTVRALIAPLDPGAPREQFRPLQAVVDKAVSPRRFIVLLLSGFAAFALILASLGIYAVIAYSVSQRTQEIGIRVALGASPAMLQNGILLRTLGLASIGLVSGTAISIAATRALRGLLFGVTATDPVTFVAMLVVLTTVAAAAGYLPARRAARIDPMIALRAE